MFSEGLEDMNDEKRAGRPNTSTTDDKVYEVKKMYELRKKCPIGILKLCSVGIAFIILAILMFAIDPLQILVDNQLTLKTGTLLYNLWLKPPLEVFISVYMFNITNVDAFMGGHDTKLKVVEAGPYVYQELLENQNVLFNGNNTVTYTPQRSVRFVRERSVGDPLVDKIVAPNIPYLGVISAAAGYSFFASMAVNALTKKFNSKPMLELTVHDYLWGYEDPLVHLASKVVPNVIHFQRFGLMERMFDEGQNVVTMKLPDKLKEAEMASDDVAVEEADRDFSIDNWNGMTGFKNWDYHEDRNRSKTPCNTLRGTYDGTLFPRNIHKGETFRVYRKAFCRSLPIQYSHPETVNGFKGYKFKLKENAFDSDLGDEETSCYCKNRRCLKKGLGNIAPCYYNIPMAVSFPHFFNGEPSLLENIEGLKPDKDRHGTEIIIQPQLGIPMRVRSRFQINLLMGNVKHNRDVSQFKNMALPIFWIEMGVEDLTPGVKMLLTLLFRVCPCLQLGLVITLIVIGVYLVFSALLCCFWVPASWNSLNASVEQAMSAEAGRKSNMGFLPLLKQPALVEVKKLPKQSKSTNQAKCDYDVTLLPLQRNFKAK
ncbi:scavenger receptor class B member 1 [Anastrepha obliqua]|uniref:scavenger receptor class B member 1 n=1 Tax=Anastrepha obliqua TaxID=95512 RepID=UPI00240A7E5F|nr:scavenger receptor class B member 1 [Anastrepha obliqua]